MISKGLVKQLEKKLSKIPTDQLKEIRLIVIDSKMIRNVCSFQKGFRNSDGSPRNSKMLLDVESIAPITTIIF